MKTKYLKVIERYLDNRMDQEERRQFEDRLQDDEALRREFDEYKGIYEAISDRDTLELRKDLKEIGRNFREKKGPAHNGRELNSLIWLAALLIISLSVVSITYMMLNSPLAPHIFRVGIGYSSSGSQIYQLDPASAEIFRYKIRSENFHLESPRDSLIVEKRNKLVFTWKMTDPKPVILDILNRHGQIVFSTGKAVQSPFIFSRNIREGIYIYRFRTESDTIHTGLFYVI